MFILIKTVIFICRGRHKGIANVETYRDRQGQTGTYRDRQGQAGTSMERQRQVGTSRDRKGMSLFVPACPCLSLSCPCLYLLVPACPWAVPGIGWHTWQIAEWSMIRAIRPGLIPDQLHSTAGPDQATGCHQISPDLAPLLKVVGTIPHLEAQMTSGTS